MESAIREQFQDLKPNLDERGRREFAATEARKLGFAGVSIVSRATGIARSTIYEGLKELKSASVEEVNGKRRARRRGGGRKQLEQKDPTIVERLKAMLEATTLGDPESALLWTAKSARRLARELREEGFRIGRTKVRKLLRRLGYSLQAARKVKDGTSHPDRDAQFNYINERTRAQLKSGNPAISVDTKKKELVGEFKNGGCEWRPKGKPLEVNVHDFPSQGDGRAVPYGVYDIAANEGWVSVGVSHDTASFAAETIRRWWGGMGEPRYPQATELLITADCGGSNGYRVPTGVSKLLCTVRHSHVVGIRSSKWMANWSTICPHLMFLPPQLFCASRTAR